MFIHISHNSWCTRLSSIENLNFIMTRKSIELTSSNVVHLWLSNQFKTDQFSLECVCLDRKCAIEKYVRYQIWSKITFPQYRYSHTKFVKCWHNQFQTQNIDFIVWLLYLISCAIIRSFFIESVFNLKVNNMHDQAKQFGTQFYMLRTRVVLHLATIQVFWYTKALEL